MESLSLTTFFLLIATAAFAQASRIGPASSPASSTQLQDEKLLLFPVEARECLTAVENIMECASHINFSLATLKFSRECCDAIDAAVDKCVGGIIPNFQLPIVFKNYCHIIADAVAGAPKQSPPVYLKS